MAVWTPKSYQEPSFFLLFPLSPIICVATFSGILQMRHAPHKIFRWRLLPFACPWPWGVFPFPFPSPFFIYILLCNPSFLLCFDLFRSYLKKRIVFLCKMINFYYYFIFSYVSSNCGEVVSFARFDCIILAIISVANLWSAIC